VKNNNENKSGKRKEINLQMKVSYSKYAVQNFENEQKREGHHLNFFRKFVNLIQNE